MQNKVLYYKTYKTGGYLHPWFKVIKGNGMTMTIIYNPYFDDMKIVYKEQIKYMIEYYKK